MKMFFASLVLCFASLSQASVGFKAGSKAPFAVQQKMNEAIVEQCPLATSQNWEILEGRTESFQINSSSVYFKSEFAVYGILEDGQQPENGGLTIDAVLNSNNQVQILSLKGLCR